MSWCGEVHIEAFFFICVNANITTHTIIQIRHLKLQPLYRKNTWGQTKETSQLRLCGNWLEQAGFFPKQSVTVTVKKGKLIISA